MKCLFNRCNHAHLNHSITMEKFDKGVAYFKEGKFVEALTIFDQVIDVQTADTEIILYRGRTLSRMGRFTQSLQDFDQLVQLEPYNTNFISDRAVVLHLLQKNEEALSELDRALTLDPNNPYRYSSRAFLKERMGDLYGAIADYDKAIELDPEDAVAYNNKGIVEEKLGYQEKSQKSFNMADELVGYTPTNGHTGDGLDQEKAVPEQLKQGNPDNKLTISSYLNTLANVFNNSGTRKDFFAFLSNKFKNK